MPLGDPLTEPGVTDPGAVGERPLPVLGERPRRRLGHRIAGQDVGAGRPAGEGNRVATHTTPTLATPTLRRFPPTDPEKGGEPRRV